MKTSNEVKNELLQLRSKGYSFKQLSKKYEEMTGKKIKPDSIRKQLNRWKPTNKVIGVIGDVHLPFEHENYLQFCVETFKKWNVTDVIFIGDLIDNHAISRHTTEIDAYGGYTEYRMAKEKLQAWKMAFPNAKLVKGNHDTIPTRQAKTLSLHYGFLKTFKEAWELDWEVSDEFIIDGVIYTHGLSSGGINGSLNYAQKRRLSCVLGHKHSIAGCRYSDNGIDKIFALDVGCGINSKEYAFRYGKTMPHKPVLGAGIVISSEEAYFIPMKKDTY